jgi:hypothetical protein
MIQNGRQHNTTFCVLAAVSLSNTASLYSWLVNKLLAINRSLRKKELRFYQELKYQVSPSVNTDKT